jgi:hypothetical protein
MERGARDDHTQANGGDMSAHEGHVETQIAALESGEVDRDDCVALVNSAQT